MIIGISLALLIAGTLLVLLNHKEIPEIPIYIASGVLLSLIVTEAEALGLVSHGFVEAEIMEKMALLGLSILVFYSTSSMVIDPGRKTAIKSFKTSIWVSTVSFAGITGISLYFGFGRLESLMFGVTAAVGSTLLDSGLVKEEARKDHIYGWLTEDMNFFDDLFGIIAISILISSLTGFSVFEGLLVSLIVILSVLVTRNIFSKIVLRVTDGENELILLSGITTLIALSWITENAGISALAGVYAAGLMMVDTSLGYRVRERFSPIKDFFTALSFISIGFLLYLPQINYLLMAILLLAFVTTIRPMISVAMLRIQGYDLRTSFMASIQSSQISEITVIGALLVSEFTQNPLFDTVAIGFAATALIAHLIEDREQIIFEKLFSKYELDSEKTNLPVNMRNHVIIAGYDWKTRGLEDLIDEKIVVADYSLERIEEAESRGHYHVLSDLQSDETWRELEVGKASKIVSAVNQSSVMEKIESLDTDAEKILVDADSEEVRERLRQMLENSLE